MPLQPINYAGIAPIQNQQPDIINRLVQGLMQGAQLRRMPQQMDAALQHQQLQNQLLQTDIQYEPQMKRAQLADILSKARERNAMSQLPLGGKMPPGAAGQALWLDAINKAYGQESPVAKQASSDVDLARQLQKAQIARGQSLAQSTNFRYLPTAERERFLATAAGLGYTPDEAVQLRNQGQSLRDMAAAKNVNLEDVQPNYPLSQGEVAKQHQRTSFANEIQTLEDNINKGMQGLGFTIGGVSPKQLMDNIAGMNKERQADIIAAKILGPELAGIRLQALGGRVGIEGIKELSNLANQGVKVYAPRSDDELRGMVNKRVSDIISKATDAFSRSQTRQAALPSQPQLRSGGASSAKKELTYNPSTGRFE